MRAFIYTGGEICAERITERPKAGDLVVAADAGYLNAKAFGLTPDVVLGDFDSYSGEIPKEIKRITVPAEKDETDTQLALSYVLEQGADDVVFVGGLGGRLDHTLSNLAILERLDAKGIHALITDGFNRARFLRDNSTLLPRSSFRYFALLSADPVVKGVTLDGCKYPLKKARLSRLDQYAVSNEIVGNCAFIEVRRGGVWIVES